MEEERNPKTSSKFTEEIERLVNRFFEDWYTRKDITAWITSEAARVFRDYKSQNKDFAINYVMDDEDGVIYFTTADNSFFFTIFYNYIEQSLTIDYFTPTKKNTLKVKNFFKELKSDGVRIEKHLYEHYKIYEQYTAGYKREYVAYAPQTYEELAKVQKKIRKNEMNKNLRVWW